MQDYLNTLILKDRNLGKALREIRSKMKNDDVELIIKLEDIEQNYQLMLSFMMKGYKDPKIDSIYSDLLRSLYHLSCSHFLFEKIKNNTSFAQANMRSKTIVLQKDIVLRKLEGFVQDVAYASLTSGAEPNSYLDDLYKEHQDYLDKLFCAILVSPPWTQDMKELAKKTILSPTVASNDSMLLLSAVSLASMNMFDINKWMALVEIFESSTDVRIKQRALVGLVLSVPSCEMTIFPEVANIISHLMSDECVRKQLIELQIQILYCNNADADTAKIQNEIMPSLIKNNNINISSSGIMEKDDDSFEDILDPGAADRKMEELEKAVGNIMDMQKAGADIYFGGFSQMKRFPFFNVLSNWFCPFFFEHPMLKGMYEKFSESKFIDIIFEKGPFCDSDKYSFAYAISSVIDRIPDNMREMLINSDAIDIPGFSDVDKGEAAYVRRMYLQDLYRFFRLYNCRNDFYNPFNVKQNVKSVYFSVNKIFARNFSIDDIVELDKFFYKYANYQSVISLSDSVIQIKDINHSIILAMSHMRLGNYSSAVSLFSEVLRVDSCNEQALKGIARISYENGDYERAVEYYKKLVALNSDNRQYVLNLAISKVNAGQLRDGMDILFKLNYENPNDYNIKRSIAWGYLLEGKANEADSVYNELLLSKDVFIRDKLNAGYAKWFISQIEDALVLFREYVGYEDGKSCNGKDKLYKEFLGEKTLFESYGITVAEVNIMVDIV